MLSEIKALLKHILSLTRLTFLKLLQENFNYRLHERNRLDARDFSRERKAVFPLTEIYISA